MAELFDRIEAAKSPECNTMTATLRCEGFDTIFELHSLRTVNNMPSCRKASSGVRTGAIRDDMIEACFEQDNNDVFVDSSLLWRKFPRHGQSELYLSLCKTGWRPMYLRTSSRRHSHIYENTTDIHRRERLDMVLR